MGSWFGDLDLAYKYTLVFGSLLALTIIAGLIKVFIDRRKLKKLSKQKDEENAPREEQTELNRREKDEGDLFGIRAIEAGYFAGIPQSRPTSRAGSIAGGPTMSSSTLVGGFNSPKAQPQSMGSSVTSLPLAHTQDRNIDSGTLPTPPRRTSPPAIKLRPSEAELSGRINHNAAVNMSLDVPPYSNFAQHSQSASFSGSDSGESDIQTLKSEHYSPVPPQVPMQHNLRISVTSVDSIHRSHTASVNDPSPPHSPNRSGPPSPRHRPISYIPSMPERALSNESQSQIPTGYEPEQSQEIVPEQPASPMMLLPQTYQPVHRRDTSDPSSIYSQKQNSTMMPKHERTSSTSSGYNFSFPRSSPRNCVDVATSKEPPRRPVSSSLLAPLSSEDKMNDPRFSEFYDVYFRNSQLNAGLKLDAPADSLRQSTIVEVPSSLPAPQPSKPGLAT